MHFFSLLSISSLLALARPAPIPDNDCSFDLYGPQNTSSCPDYCVGTANNHSLSQTYICGDSRLGPNRLPTRLPLSTLTETYDRFGGLCPGQFLAKWYNNTAGSYIYPPDNGFQLDIENKVIDGTMQFPVGFVIDRFGSEYGTFVSPAGAPYMQRALPPSNLDTPQTAPLYPYNYHVYRVLQPIDALAGPIASWFGQPGQGVQYLLSQNILTLLNTGYLERVDLPT